MFSGYLDNHDPPRWGYAIVTNFQDFQCLRDRSEAQDEFSVTFWNERRPLEHEATLVQRVGSWTAMTVEDERALRGLLKDRKPAAAIIGKAVELVHQMADRPSAHRTIGKRLSVIRVARDARSRVDGQYYSDVRSCKSYLPDVVILRPQGGVAAKDITIQLLGRGGSSGTLVVPKVGRNQPCPCNSGKKYKRCHGRPIPSRLA
jgi:hypothetical protein